jgi:Sulfotransferase domain
MALRVIGAGWGRTGTMSVKRALEWLGLPCHHMHEVFLHPEHVALFEAAARGEPDWETIYADYAVTLDWPGCSFWRELTAYYPDAKVLLTVRDPKDWCDSFFATVRGPIATFDDDWGDMARSIVVERDLDGDIDDPAHVQACFERHNDEVRASIPPDRLLVYEVTEGWEPLCAFLDLPVPDVSFPKTNDRESFGRRNA